MVNLKLLKLACADCRVVSLCLPRGLDREDMERLDGIVKRGPPLQRGQYLYRQGDPMRGVFAVRAGSLRAFTSAADGTEQTVGFYLLGEVLGFDGLERERHTCAAVALETTAVCELPLSRLEELCAELPPFSSSCSSSSARRSPPSTSRSSCSPTAVPRNGSRPFS